MLLRSAEVRDAPDDVADEDEEIPTSLPPGLALKKTLFPCRTHELYFVSHEALTQHFIGM